MLTQICPNIAATVIEESQLYNTVGDVGDPSGKSTETRNSSVRLWH